MGRYRTTFIHCIEIIYPVKGMLSAMLKYRKGHCQWNILLHFAALELSSDLESNISKKNKKRKKEKMLKKVDSPQRFNFF